MGRIAHMRWIPSLLILTTAGYAQTAFDIPTSVTKHSMTLKGQKFDYSVTAAQLPLRNAEGEVEVKMFYAAYTKDGADAGTRPVVFAFNGGPGSATMWLHMGGLAPKMAPMPVGEKLPKPPYTVQDNPDTWLDFADVVCIDAPATGYSRLTKSDLGKKYFGVRQDIAAFTEFIRAWLTEHKRWSSPLFIAGESYGGIRGSGLVKSLFDTGIAVSGFISISGTNNYMTLDGMRGNDATYISFLPTLATTAWYHKKLAPKFKSVEQVSKEALEFANGDYALALSRGDSLPAAEREKVAARMSELIGLSKKFCLGANLRVPEFTFFKEIRREEGLAVGRLDSRFVAKEETQVGGQRSDDPTDDVMTAPYYSAFNDYVQNTLGVKTTMKYLIYGPVRPWAEPEGSYAETGSDLRDLIAANPHFRVLYMMGYYDLACPYNGTLYTVNHMNLDTESRKQISYEYYPAGHMMYIEAKSRTKFHDDAAKFVRDTLAGK